MTDLRQTPPALTDDEIEQELARRFDVPALEKTVEVLVGTMARLDAIDRTSPLVERPVGEMYGTATIAREAAQTALVQARKVHMRRAPASLIVDRLVEQVRLVRGRRRKLVVLMPPWMARRYLLRRPAISWVDTCEVHVESSPAGPAVDEMRFGTVAGSGIGSVFLAPDDLDEGQAEVYQQLRADGVEVRAAHETATVI